MNNESMLFSKKRILTVKQLSKLTHHTYACNNTSVLEPFLQPWWNFLVSKTPIWLAPNLITILGLIVNIATTLVLVVYSPNGVSSPPRWTCVLCAVGLFIYQSLDSIDGKQARRTNTSSPLGELFDHGCDAISTVFVALAACLSCQLGHYPKWLFFQCFCAIVLFYCAHWQTYVSGTLRFGNIDVTEAQFIIILIHLTSAIFGSEIWMTKIFGNVELWFFISLLTTACCIWSLSHTCSIILNGGAGKNGSTVAGTSVLSPSIPLSLVLFLAYIIARKSPENVFVENASLYIISFGMITAKITNKLVIAHMTKAEIEYLDSSLLGPAIMLLNQYFNCVLPEIWLLWFTLFWAMQDLIRYCLQVCLEIRTHLHIGIFTISRPQRGTINPVTKTMVSCGTTAGDKKNAKYRQRLTR